MHFNSRGTTESLKIWKQNVFKEACIWFEKHSCGDLQKSGVAREPVQLEWEDTDRLVLVLNDDVLLFMKSLAAKEVQTQIIYVAAAGKSLPPMP